MTSTNPQQRPRHNNANKQRLPVTIDASSPTKTKSRKGKSSLKGTWLQLQTVYGTNNLMIFLGVFVLCSIVLLMHPNNSGGIDMNEMRSSNVKHGFNMNSSPDVGYRNGKNYDIPAPGKNQKHSTNTGSSEIQPGVQTRRPMMVKLRDGGVEMHNHHKGAHQYSSNHPQNVIRVSVDEDKWKTFRQVDRKKEEMYALGSPLSSRDWRHRQSDNFINGRLLLLYMLLCRSSFCQKKSERIRMILLCRFLYIFATFPCLMFFIDDTIEVDAFIFLLLFDISDSFWQWLMMFHY